MRVVACLLELSGTMGESPERRQLVLQLRAFVKKALLPPGRAELWPFNVFSNPFLKKSNFGNHILKNHILKNRIFEKSKPRPLQLQHLQSTFFDRLGGHRPSDSFFDSRGGPFSS